MTYSNWQTRVRILPKIISIDSSTITDDENNILGRNDDLINDKYKIDNIFVSLRETNLRVI